MPYNKFLSILYYCLLGTIVPGMAQVPANGTHTAATPVSKPGALKVTKLSSVRTWVPSMVTTDANVVFDSSRSTADVKLVTQYLDGLGRPIQTVARRVSPKGNDMVTAVVYDSLGRQQFQYLPYVQQKDSAKNGKIKSNPFAAQAEFYQDVNLNPGVIDEHVYYSQTEYEASPLNRVLKTWAPGDSWAKTGGNHPVEMRYYYNKAADSVRIWNIAISKTSCSGTTNYGTGSATKPTTSGIYEAGQLTKNIIIDESGHQTVEYKDKNDLVILKKVQLADNAGSAHTGWLCTYYVYDDMNNLRFVIPPLGVQNMMTNWKVSDSIANGLCFQYEYDGRGRMVSKKVPGAGAVYMAYDSRNRPVFVQDAVQRGKTSPEWMTTFYDGLNRPYETAIYTTTSTRDALQCSVTTNLDDTSGSGGRIPANLVVSEYSSADTPYRATNKIFFMPGFSTPVGGSIVASIVSSDANKMMAANPVPNISSSALTPLTYTYYDDYSFDGVLSYVSTDNSKLQAGDNLYSQPVTEKSTRVNTLPTGAKTRVLGTDQFLLSTSYYDDEGRVVQSISENNVGGKDVQSSLYDYNGKVLSSYITHTNPASTATPKTTLLHMMAYDNAGQLMSTTQRLNDSSSLEHTLASNSYYELGTLQQKSLGGDALVDSLTYTYNIRGWLSGINKAFINTASTDNWFGEELHYDQGFDTQAYNGNIAGSKWKSKSNGIARAYGYSYDPINRLTQAKFTEQKTTGDAWTVDKVDFSVNGITYDANGNIKSLKEQGLVGTSSRTIDTLIYSYPDNSNQLSAVHDSANTATDKLGDFVDGNKSGNDYAYDVNGNLIKDLNKGIASISYNYLNLPEKITITGKGSITYQYNAAGVKMKKTVVDSTVNPVKTTVSDYDGIFLYQQDTLQYVSHEEGRIRPVYDSGKAVQYTWDYFEKDHLGNVRMVLGTKSDTSVYAATMETGNSANENALFSNIDNTRDSLPPGYPVDETTNPNAFVSKLNAVSGQKIGASIVLRVMAGDTVQLGVKAFYKSIGASTSSTTSSSMLTALIQALSGSSISSGAHSAMDAGDAIKANFNSSTYDELKNKDADENLSDKPKAYLNYVLFDDMFNMVDENSGVKQVQGSPDELQTLAVDKSVMKKSGFLYIYTSNESGENVYFDNLVISHNGGPLLEETHYYPYGLTMVGISSKALKSASYPENHRKYNGIEFNDDFDLNQYDAFYRTLDPQIGRWWQIDPKPNDAISPYAAMDNNPIRYNDFLGDTTIAGAGFWRNAWEGLKDGGRSTIAWGKSLGTAEGWGKTLDGMAAMSPFNVDEGSVGARAQMIDNTVNYVSDLPNKTSDQIGHDVGYGTEKIAETVAVTKGAELVKSGITILNSTTLYRAVSGGELTSISGKAGLSMAPGTYETGKLFATSSSDAAQFGKFNFGFDAAPNTIIKVRVPNVVMKTATSFTADGMPAVSIPANQLPRINFIKPLNFSPRPSNPFNSSGW